MIRAYTTSNLHAEAVLDAAASKGFEAECVDIIDIDELSSVYEELNVLIFDLTSATFSADAVVKALDSLETDRLPPVLYLLSCPADIEVITEVGSIVNQDYSFVPIETTGLAARLEVLTKLGARRRLTMESAITDRLTGLYNRKYFIRRLEEEMYRAMRYSYNVGVMLVSVDFSAKDGDLTEQASTEVIKAVASFFIGRLRKSDIIARYKWDDYALLLPDISPEDSKLVAEDVKRKVEALDLVADGLDIKIGISVGHVSLPCPGVGTAVELIGILEDCCLEAKASGNGVIDYVPKTGT
jgi:diguanylate cyclase (GGDEF)-like protein